MELVNNQYQIQGLDVSEICKEFGTPLYVYDGKKIIQQLQSLKNAFSENQVKVKYAAKALTNISILKLLKKYGAGVDVVLLWVLDLSQKKSCLPLTV
jgi:diaminopimelate decarboxylase